MLSIILLILKIIGTILLIILGLLLLIILIVLLVPIRYRVVAEHGEDFRMEGRANWLLHVINARITHLEGVLHIRVRVLWFLLYDNLNPKPPKTESRKRKKSQLIKKSRVKQSEIKRDLKTERKEDYKTGKKEDSKTRKIEVLKTDKDIVNELKPDASKTVLTQKTDISSKFRTDGNQVLDEVKMEQNMMKVETQQKPVTEKPIKEVIDNSSRSDNEKLKLEIINASKQEDGKTDQNDEEKKSSIYDKVTLRIKMFIEMIKGFQQKIKRLVEKLITFFRELKSKISRLYETALNIKHKKDLITDFIKDELNREGFRITYSSLKRLFKHILPTKLKSSIIFGTGDPCSTGQALGAMSILYSFYGDKVQITPDFENKRLEGKHYARGRIRLITILIIVIKLILDKRFQQLKSNFLILKEAL